MIRVGAALVVLAALALPVAAAADDTTPVAPAPPPTSLVVALALDDPALQAGVLRGREVILARGFEVELARTLSRRLGGRVERFVHVAAPGRLLAAGAREHGTVVRITPDVVRDLGVEAAERTLEVARKFADDGVVGLNCAGSERSEIAPFGPVFRAAKEAGLRSVPHAGEWAGPENVWQTLEHFLPDRIGHGVRAIDDPRLVERLAAAQIPLEISPISNVATGVYRSLEEHPFLRLRDAGVVVTLNSDDPPMFDAWIGDVFEAARRACGLSDEALAEIARTGVRCSFADDATKAALEEGIDAWLADPGSS